MLCLYLVHKKTAPEKARFFTEAWHGA